MSAKRSASGAAPAGRFANTGDGPRLIPVDIGHKTHLALIEPDTAFWSLVRKGSLAETLRSPRFLGQVRANAAAFAREMHDLRFGLTPSAVYFNPTARCNLNCGYCYIPAEMRRYGEHMPTERLLDALARLKDWFGAHLPAGRLPQVVFHGAEPLLNREAVFAGIERYAGDFSFGVQTNATNLDEAAIAFLTGHKVGIGLSLDAATARIAKRTRATWGGKGVYDVVVRAMERLKGYPLYNVICTVTRENMRGLPQLVDFFHKHEVPVTMLNILRCTMPASRALKPDEAEAAKCYIAALERSYELYRETGRKLVVANFANILLSIVAPTARRLMCDISPCGGGRCFFALGPDGGLFPCSEFIGLPDYNGGNLFTDELDDVLASPAFKRVTGRKVEDIEPCRTCAIRHFCGSPCPAEAQEMNGGMDQKGAFCAFYEEQVRYAFRLLADKKADAFLFDGWDKDVETVFDVNQG
ncbi:MAG: peptide-modifying radical SAM enzyme CbpB [Humidesulfovibrio sp.]|nr:peptide-modifying radical SAM enzyme CbpB [Humidesulfovibrio sp.]